MKRVAFVAALLVAAAAGCEHKPKEEPAATTPPAVEQPKVAETQPASVNTDQAVLDQVPVPEDFEEQAARQVTAENLDTELQNLEKELAE